jgi:hypothetical protein
MLLAKVRPKLNLHAPNGQSLNDAIDKIRLRKPTMCSPNKFGQMLRRAEANALFARLDFSDASKLIPCTTGRLAYVWVLMFGEIFTWNTNSFQKHSCPGPVVRFGRDNSGMTRTRTLEKVVR